MKSSKTKTKTKKAKNAKNKKAVKTPPDTVFVLRTCNADMTAHSGFKWPTSGPVACNDWDPAPVCGQGLHGLLWGEGDGSLLNWDESAKWLVVEVAASDIVNLQGKVKFPKGVVMFCGAAAAAVAFISVRVPNTVRAIVGGTSTSGYGGTSTSGYGGTSTSGYGGTSTSGDGGTSTSGDGGEIRIRWYEEKTSRYRTAIGYIGENGLVAGVAYVVREGKIVKKD